MSLSKRRQDRGMWRNWAGNQSCSPTKLSSPASTEALAEIVATATRAGQRVKAVGSGHSFTAAACTDGVLVSLDHLGELHGFDAATLQVTVGAGIRLDVLNVLLDSLGLAMPNLGDIAVQTLAGATATATHGTGRLLGNLSTAIVGFELVTASGDVLWCDGSENAELFEVGRVSVGALGVITKMRLKCVPAFVVRAREQVESLAEVMADWARFTESADHAELFFVPGGDGCFTKRNDRVDEAPQAQSKVKTFIEKELIENGVLDLAMRTVKRFPGQRDRLAELFVKAAGDRTVVDKSFRVFASPRRVRFVEMEYSVPVGAIPEVVGRVDRAAMALPEPPLFPIEVRCSAADDIALSSGFGRANGWVAVHQYRGVEFEPYFRAVEAVMADYDSRPHWGKMHFQTHESLRDRYEGWGRFQAVRAGVDPTGTFTNDYLDRVLGPIG